MNSKPVIDEIEKLVIERVLRATKGNKQKASDVLGMNRRRLYGKLKKYGLNQSATTQA
jgi:DNA-binding protein Fis